MSYRNEMQTMRDVLLGEQADRRKLDMLVRQGMMSPAQLPMLHRGLDKLQAGKTLNPMERTAVAKVLDSLMYIVTGDDTVFQKARQHTQKTKYQTEETDQVEETDLEEKMDLAKADMGDVIKDFKKSDAPQFKGKSDKKKREMAIAAKLDADKDDMKEAEEKVKCDKCDGKGCKHCDNKGYHMAEGAMSRMDYQQKSGEKGSGLDTFKKKPAKDTLIANPKTQKVRKVTPSRAKMAVKKGFVYAEEWTDEELDALFEMAYKDKFQAMLKKTGKSLDSMSDEEKKKFFNTVDAAHNTKNEAYDTPAVKKPVSQMTPAEKKKNDERRTAYNTFQKRQRDNEKAIKDMKGMAPHMKNPALGEETIDEASPAADARRAMKADSRGLAKPKKAGDLGGTGSYNAKKDANSNIEKHGGHIVTQMKKAITVGKPVKFKDGTEKVVNKAHAHKYLSKYMSGKPAAKVDMHSAHDSHDAFMKHIS